MSHFSSQEAEAQNLCETERPHAGKQSVQIVKKPVMFPQSHTMEDTVHYSSLSLLCPSQNPRYRAGDQGRRSEGQESVEGRGRSLTLMLSLIRFTIQLKRRL